MFSMNLNELGKVLCKISGGKYDGKIVCVAENNDNDNDNLLYRNFDKLSLVGDAKFEPSPNTKQERDILYIAGPSGSGKSFYCRLYLQNYIKAFPKNQVFMFSKLNEDKSLEGLPIKRIMIDDRLISEPFDVADFKDCCVILDDIDALKEKAIKKALYDLKTEILETGRHFNTSLILTSHLACKNLETKSILSEAHSITFFMKSGMPVKTLLKNYLGMDEKQIKKLHDIPSRWITITRGFPMVIFSEKEVMFLSDLDKSKD
jgi:hypothetical protein